MFNIASKHFSIFSNKPPASWVAYILRDFLICYSCSYYSSMLQKNKKSFNWETTKWSNTQTICHQQSTNCLSVWPFLKLVLKGLIDNFWNLCPCGFKLAINFVNHKMLSLSFPYFKKNLSCCSSINRQ